MANVPLIDYTLKSLSDGGVDTVVMAVNSLADIIVGYLAHAFLVLMMRWGTGGEA